MVRCGTILEWGIFLLASVRESYANLNIVTRCLNRKWKSLCGQGPRHSSAQGAHTHSSRLIWCNWLSCVENLYCHSVEFRYIVSAVEEDAALSSAHYLIDHTEYFEVEIQKRHTDFGAILLFRGANWISGSSNNNAPKKKTKILFVPIPFSLAKENLIFLKFMRT